MATYVKLTSIALLGLLAFLGVYFIKISLNKLIPAESGFREILVLMPQMFLEFKFWLALSCYGSALIIYLFLLHGDDVSKVVPMTVGVNVLLTAVGAFFLLGDSMELQRIIGTVLVISGIYLINGS